MIRVRDARVKRGHVVTLQFTDGSQRDIDLERFLKGPVFEAIRTDESRFRELTVRDGTVAWPNGADICPDVLYHDLPLASEPLTAEGELKLKRFLESASEESDNDIADLRPSGPMRGLSEFMGLIIEMAFEPDTTPCFQVHYGEIQAKFAIDSLHQLKGGLGPIGVELVQEWAALHREELAANWERARQGLPLIQIEPLE